MSGNSYNPGSSFTPTSGYGTRTSPINGGTEFHPGQDFAAPSGTPIGAANAGVVWYSGYNAGGYGNTVVIKSDCGNGSSFFQLYAHMNGVGMPGVGQSITEGQIIGQVGNTGNSTGPHLHFEILPGTDSVSHSSGGPLGVAASNQSAHLDPNSFNGWCAAPLNSGQINETGFGTNDYAGPDGSLDSAFDETAQCRVDPGPFDDFLGEEYGGIWVSSQTPLFGTSQVKFHIVAESSIGSISGFSSTTSSYISTHPIFQTIPNSAPIPHAQAAEPRGVAGADRAAAVLIEHMAAMGGALSGPALTVHDHHSSRQPALAVNRL